MGDKTIFLLLTLLALSHSYVGIIDCAGKERQVLSIVIKMSMGQWDTLNCLFEALDDFDRTGDHQGAVEVLGGW